MLRLTGHYHPAEDGRPGLLQGWPYTVIHDAPDLIALYMPVGTRIEVADLADRRRRLNPLIHGQHPFLEFRRGEQLRLKEPSTRHSVWLHWSAEPDRQFLGWYVNVEAPWNRTAIGFDTTDLALDLVVAPDRTWQLKDEEDTRHWLQRGVFTDVERRLIHAEASSVIARIEARMPPFDHSWLDWRPPADLAPPEAPPRWELEPGAATTHFTGRSPAGVDPAYR